MNCSSWELEITRGRRETGMTPRQTVRAEVKQELGYAVKKIHLLGMIRPDSAILSAHLEVFFVELGAKGKPKPEGSEAFGEIVHLTPEELGERILDGTIRDSYTMGAFLMAQLKGLIPSIQEMETQFWVPSFYVIKEECLRSMADT